MSRAQSRAFEFGAHLVMLLALSGPWTGLRVAAQEATEYPVFEVEASWPQKLPYNWIMGHVPSVAVDSRDHVFVLSRPNTLAPEDRARSAPPVVELDAAGKFVNAWGGPGIP